MVDACLLLQEQIKINWAVTISDIVIFLWMLLYLFNTLPVRLKMSIT